MNMDGILAAIQNFFNMIKEKAMALLDSAFPPEKRAELLAKLQSFFMMNPKLSAFLLTNIALTGLPLFIFASFTVTVLIFSLVVAIILALLVAVLFTVTMVGLALLFLFPVVFFTTLAASFIFLWGLGGWYLIKWFNQGKGPAPKGDALGDKLNDLTGGRFSWLMDDARAQQNSNGHVKRDDGESQSVDTAAKQNGTVNNVASGVTKNVDAAGVTQKATGAATGAPEKITKTAGSGAGGVKKQAGNTVGTAKGAVGGVTGVTGLS